jgi:hypothetical protein
VVLGGGAGKMLSGERRSPCQHPLGITATLGRQYSIGLLRTAEEFVILKVFMTVGKTKKA